MPVAVKIIRADDGSLSVRPCEVEDEDMQGATPVASPDEIIPMLPDLFKQAESYSMEASEAENEEAENQAMNQGFKSVRGGGMYGA